MQSNYYLVIIYIIRNTILCHIYKCSMKCPFDVVSPITTAAAELYLMNHENKASITLIVEKNNLLKIFLFTVVPFKFKYSRNTKTLVGSFLIRRKKSTVFLYLAFSPSVSAFIEKPLGTD